MNYKNLYFYDMTFLNYKIRKIQAAIIIDPNAVFALTFSCRKTIPKQNIATTQQKEKIIDLISALTILVFLFCAVFLTQDPTQINVH
jgi:hypothetical protein